MLVKKLITLAGALGILACGACFLPDVLDRQPPPPLIPAMQGIKTIAVVATNSSSTHHIDTDRLAVAIAKQINWRHDATKIRAQAGTAAGPADATLSVNIVEESATSASVDKSGRTTLWTFEPKVSATLTRADGQILWQEKEQAHEVNEPLTTNDEGEAWRRFSKKEWALPYILGQDYLDQFFYGRR
jgi:hypothetical protein